MGTRVQNFSNIFVQVFTASAVTLFFSHGEIAISDTGSTTNPEKYIRATNHDDIGFKTSEPLRIPANPTSAEPSRPVQDLRKLCRDAFFQYALPLKKIASKHSPSLAGEDARLARDLLALDQSDCDSPKHRIPLIKTLSHALNTHLPVAIVLLPQPTGRIASDYATQALEKGLKSSFSGLPGLPQMRTIHLSEPAIKTMDDLLQSEFGRAFWIEKPAVVIAALSPTFDLTLAELSRALALPVVIVGPPKIEDDPGQQSSPDRKERNPKRAVRVFRVFPDQSHMAKLLARTACNRGLKKTGILRPASPEAGAFARAFEYALARCSGFVAKGGVYAKADYESVDIAVKQISESLRGGPDTGIVILDDARIARHAAKVLRNHGIRSATLLGNHRWRSPTIIQPFDPLFEQSFFVDYLDTSEVPEFPDASTLWQAIWQLNGKRAGQVAIHAIQAGKGYPRKNLHRLMMSLAAPKDSFFSSERFFSANQTSYWPAFAFTITRGALTKSPAAVQGDAPGM